MKITAIKGQETTLFKPNPAKSLINDVPGWYHGDLHLHTLHSDGKRTAQELIDEALIKKLNFIISSEHNTNSANLDWGKYDAKDLLIINGEEVTSTEFGHWNAIGLNAETYIDWRYSPDENWINKMVNKVHKDGGLAIINHPFYHVKMINSFKYDSTLFDGVEVWNGNWNILNNLAVNWWNEQLISGHKLIAVGASDSHVSEGSPNNLGSPQTVVHAQGLSKSQIIEAIKDGKGYIRSDEKIKIVFEAISENENAMLGDTLIIREGKESFFLNLKVDNCSGQNMKIISNLGLFRQEVLESDNEDLSFQVNNSKIKFLRIEIRNDEDKMVALTNPIFISY